MSETTEDHRTPAHMALMRAARRQKTEANGQQKRPRGRPRKIITAPSSLAGLDIQIKLRPGGLATLVLSGPETVVGEICRMALSGKL